MYTHISIHMHIYANACMMCTSMHAHACMTCTSMHAAIHIKQKRERARESESEGERARARERERERGREGENQDLLGVVGGLWQASEARTEPAAPPYAELNNVTELTKPLRGWGGGMRRGAEVVCGADVVCAAHYRGCIQDCTQVA